MFFDLVSRNSKRNRKENGLFFSSLLISIVAFYLILSLSHQDVMRFLKMLESDAVNKLLNMIPLFYTLTLFILFFLVYFAIKYQLESRRHELGMYVMLGMRRYKLFFLLLAEDIRNSITALLIGLPIGIVISELISLITSRVVGIGLIGHEFCVSGEAIFLTIAGFLLIKLVAFLILSGKMVHEQIGDLLVQKPEGSKKNLPMAVYLIALIVGAALLTTAYVLAINGNSWAKLQVMALTLLCGFVGTMLLFFGLRSIMNLIAGNTAKSHKLHTFNFRQLQEMVIRKSNTMAVTSMLILAGMCCFGSGVAIAVYHTDSEAHTIDYTFQSVKENGDAKEELREKNLDSLFDKIFDVNIGYIKCTGEIEGSYSMDNVMKEIDKLPASRDKEVLENNLGYSDYPYLISLTGYNQLLMLAGQQPLQLAENQVAVYRDKEFTTDSRTEILNNILKKNPEIQMGGETHYLTGQVQSTNLVVDRSITLSFGLIVPDTVFERMTTGIHETYVNASLSHEQIKGNSLIEAVMTVNDKLNSSGLLYESYLQNMGRQLFYVVAASYITIYLAIVFLIIANTVIGVQFLTQQQKTRHRYQTLIWIGASYDVLCSSARKQIYWYFAIPVVIASISSIFGIWSLLTGILSESAKSNLTTFTGMGISLAMILLIIVVECIYITVVTKTSDRFLLTLMTPEREE